MISCLLFLRKTQILIHLQVEAYPAAVSFRWFFNSSEYEEWKGHEEFSQTGLKSELQFLPKTSKDYGTLFCIGENAIGRQEEACVFQVREEVLIPLLTCLCRSCPRASRPPSPAARSSTRLSPPSKFSVRKVNLVPKRKFSLLKGRSFFKALTAVFPPTSCLSSTTLRRWSSSLK